MITKLIHFIAAMIISLIIFPKVIGLMYVFLSATIEDRETFHAALKKLEKYTETLE